jgi:hypothetical protein
VKKLRSTRKLDLLNLPTRLLSRCWVSCIVREEGVGTRVPQWEAVRGHLIA